ncbi:Haloacid Dehalogenase superfamily, subfamily IB, phosphoserine phosphatase-like [Sphingomonas gellani]|uniref:Haloacid Dehalogenase superfamily, subfamily IB, phosphoserine phosphatase-like n=1 Tax=Sphingomonas gellani TaxID=1166340 RepID=A0A1H8DTA0_9SPHN|nr:HAD-IB family phosphatase [Sphingomonas gellani]SEN10541.1 Haloacid Dehalogenase superfamily, subfamily IB, phosphoserine phosphatase-like [Sphingomonas gellani]
MSAPVKLAIYDLDRTITRVPTWSLFLLFASRRIAPWRLATVPLLAPAALLRMTGAIGRDDLKQVMHRLLLGHAVAPERLERVAEAFAKRFVARDILAGARHRMARDHADGWRVVIATAAHRFYAEPIARRLGVDDVVATDAARAPGGAILSTIDGGNCYGSVKQAMIADWLARQGIAREQARIRFYSDHVSDRYTFDWVDEAVAVNAHPPLARLAASRGWQVLNWRKGHQG